MLLQARNNPTVWTEACREINPDTPIHTNTSLHTHCAITTLSPHPMSKESIRKSIIDLRANIARERELKKKDNQRIAGYVRSATTPASKARYRKDKIDVAARHDRNIETYKRRIESLQRDLKNCK